MAVVVLRMLGGRVLPRQGSRGVQMADSDSQSVGHVRRLGHGLQMQQVRDHGLDLRFFSAAVAHDRRFDGQGSILGDYQMRSEVIAFVSQAIEAFSGMIESVTLSKPTLEDVFIARTGHRFWEDSQ